VPAVLTPTARETPPATGAIRHRLENRDVETDFDNRNIVIIGAGKTGLALARFFSARGACVTVSDRASRTALAGEARQLRQMGVTLEAGAHRAETLGRAELVVLSPGVPHDLPVLVAARERGVPVTGEVELAAGFIREPIVAVTGTNGKTTTVTLIGEMLKASGKDVWVGGNIGRPLIDYVQTRSRRRQLVVELSSFQLDTIETFRPQIAVLLNVSADHLDRYATLADYTASKARIFENQAAADTAVVNAGDPRALAAAAKGRGRLLTFIQGPPEKLPTDHGAAVDEKTLVIRMPETGGQARLDLSAVALRGGHNRENIAAAALAALAAGAHLGAVRSVLVDFRGLPHRLQPAGTVGGVEYVNDSKATNVDAVLRALESFERRVVLIMGGRSKGDDFGLLREPLARNARALVVMGEAADRLLERLDGVVETRRAADMRAAVALARQLARPGDVVLLAPGCSSFDAYRDYRQRGEDFLQKVAELK
jgi:UDP-N-acetylmuramoylalanine--D-glutamate ligase